MVLTGLVVIVTILVFAINENEDQITESASTLEAQIQATTRPDTPIAVAVPADEEPTLEPTEEAMPEVETTEGVEMEEYVSATEFFSVMVPAGWRSEETFPGGALVMANSEAAFDRFDNDGALESGDLVLNVGFLPFELFRQREVVPLNIQFEATPDVFMQSVLPVFRASADAVPGDVELVSISDERDAGMMTVSDGRREGLILMYIAGDEVIAVVSAVGFPGEIDAFQETVLAIASGVSFSGAQGELYGALLEG
jgi:hypothetical protein